MKSKPRSAVQSWKVRLAVALLASVPSVIVRFAHLPIGATGEVVVFGAAIIASGFLLSWAAEAAQVDISASLAIAMLALIAVLPEYAVDLYFAFTAGHRPEYTQYAAANMTGGNRLLIGLGWPLAAFVFMLGARRRRQRSTVVPLEPRLSVELIFLAAASAYIIFLPLTRRISIVDSAVLLALFAAYGWRVSQEERSEPDLVGVAAAIADLKPGIRRPLVALLFVFAAAFILASAEPFAESLIQAGKAFGIDEFLLVQWLAPLASESPELLVAVVLAWRGHSGGAFGTLLSSKVNQWTLLVGSLPIAYAAGGGGWSLPLDARQNEEFFLTAAQTIMGFAVLVDLRIAFWEACALLVLFSFQFPFPQQAVRLGFAAAYGVIAIVVLVQRRSALPPLFRALRPGRSKS